MKDHSFGPKSEQRVPNVERKLWKPWDIFVSSPPTELKAYGEETTLHGLKYVFQSERHYCEKIFWTISFISGIVMAGFLIYGVCMSFLKNPVVVTYQVEETKIGGIPFPAVTLCNTNRVRKSVAAELIKSAKEAATLACCSGETEFDGINESLKGHLKKLKCIDYICQAPELFGPSEDILENSSLYDMFLEEIEDTNGQLSVELNIDEHEVIDIRELATHPCNEYALHCTWANAEYNCSDLFTFVLTDEGFCCVFNKIPAISTTADLNNMYENAANEASWGTGSSKLESLLGKTKHDSEIRTWLRNIAKIRTQKRGGRAEGLSVVLNPQLEEYYCSSFTSPGFVFKTHLPVDTPEILQHSTPIPPNTEVFVSIVPEAIYADLDIKWFNIGNRRCYFEGEYKLKVFSTYTKENCLVECEAALLEEICGCRMVYVNYEKNNTCGPDNQICVTAAFKHVISKKLSERCSHCLSTCNELHYIENIITSPISERNSKFYTGRTREFYKEWVNKSASILHVYFEDDSFYARERKQLYSLTDLIANIGGLLGLCLGFSGLSLIELAYFFFIRPCFKRRGNVSPDEEKDEDFRAPKTRPIQCTSNFI